MLNTQISTEWDRLEAMEFALWSEENPAGSLKAFQAHLDRLNGKSPAPLAKEVLTRDETRRLRQQAARMVATH